MNDAAPCPFCACDSPRIETESWNTSSAAGTSVFVECPLCCARGPLVVLAGEKLDQYGQGTPDEADTARAIELWNGRGAEDE